MAADVAPQIRALLAIRSLRSREILPEDVAPRAIASFASIDAGGILAIRRFHTKNSLDSSLVVGQDTCSPDR